MGAAKIEIPDSVRQETTDCPNDFQCLKDGLCGNQEMCRIDRSYAFGMASILPPYRQVSASPYCVSFGRGRFCTCPVRSYLYNHGISKRLDAETSAHESIEVRHCPFCETPMERIARTNFMRYLRGSKNYECPNCRRKYLRFFGLYFRHGR